MLLMKVELFMFTLARNNTIIDAGASFSDVVHVTSDWVNISGFTLQNGWEHIYFHAGIDIQQSSNNTITNNIFLDNNVGIDVIGSSNNTIYNNTIYQNQYGIYLWFSSNNQISGNNISFHIFEGIIAIYNSSNNTISDNLVINNKDGIRLDNSNYNVIFDNNISSNLIAGMPLVASENNIISNNIIMSNNDEGVSIHSSNYNTFFNNCIKNNGLTGIYLYPSTINNTIFHNNLLNNNPNAFDSGINTWDNVTLQEGNYYDDYAGEDNNGDGIGDTPYNISGGSNQDLYPLMHLWGENLPVANFTYDIDGATVSFDASSSYDRDGAIVTWLWDFGDGVEGAGEIIEHTYSEGGTFEVTLTVIDDDGYEGQITKSIEIEAEYEFERMILLGRITNLDTEEDIITFEAVNLRAITFSPFSFNPYASGEQVIISKKYLGFVGANFIFALCDAVIEET